jgi:hypothetical protein
MRAMIASRDRTGPIRMWKTHPVTEVYPSEARGIAIARAMAPGPSMSRLPAKLEGQ